MKKHLCLIFTPIDAHYQDALTHFAPPLGLVALKNYVEQELPGCYVSILDGSVNHNVTTICSFISQHKPDVVGQSIQLISYDNSLVIAEHAKSLGLINVLGGHQATQMANEIIARRSDIVDYVVVGDGEEAIVGILRGNIDHTPNLVFQKSGTIMSTPRRRIIPAKLPLINYAGVDLVPYQSRLREAPFNTSGLKNYLRVYSHKGCGNRGNSVGCVFCGRADAGVRFKEPIQFWQDIQQAISVHGADYVFDVGDDFLHSSSWIRSTASARPDISQTYELGIFGRANRVTPEVGPDLRTIGVTDVVIGFESGDEHVLKLCGKANTTPATNIRAAEILFQNDIDITASFVLGLPGETRHSLDQTIAAAGQIVKLAMKYLGRPPREMVANLVEPSPGSPAYRTLQTQMPERYIGTDKLSLEEMQRDYFRCYFGLESERKYQLFRCQLREAALEIHSLVGFSDAQGWLTAENF